MSAGGASPFYPPAKRGNRKGSIRVEFGTPGAPANRWTSWQFEEEEPPTRRSIVGITPRNDYKLKLFVAEPHTIPESILVNVLPGVATVVTITYRGR